MDESPGSGEGVEGKRGRGVREENTAQSRTLLWECPHGVARDGRRDYGAVHRAS